MPRTLPPGAARVDDPSTRPPSNRPPSNRPPSNRPTADPTDIRLMRRALVLAAAPGFAKGPNPRVGCVLVASGEVVGEGWHRGAGWPHAEVEALAVAGPRASGATAYVTLEPCRHHGRTGPCTDALLAAGVRRVVWAADDPNPVAAGGGGLLAAAGVAGSGGLLAAEAEELNRTWTFGHRHGRPHVTWKVAGTLDGRSAAADGTSRWITSAAARADVHRLRARAGAVLAGTGTVLTDDAHLAARDRDGAPLPRVEQPLRVVVGRRSVPSGSRVCDGSAETLQVTSHDPAVVLATLADHGIHDVLLEGGATLAAAFWRAGLVDEVVAYLAPVLLGAGPAVLGDLGIATIADAQRLEVQAVDVLDPGPDANIRLIARTRCRSASGSFTHHSRR